MSVKVMGLIWDHFPLGGGERLTALCLADHAGHEGENIFPAVATVARKTMQSERTVQRHIAQMKASGWLVEVERATGVPGMATRYRIPIEAIPRDAKGGVTKLHPSDGCQIAQGRVTPEVKRGDTAMAHELGVNVIRTSSAIALPDWVPKDAWAAWLEVRSKCKPAAPNTPRALTLALKSLMDLRAGGHNPRAILETATVRGWKGLFAPKEAAGQGKHPMATFNSDEAIERRAKELGIPTIGLTWPELRRRVREADGKGMH